MPGKSEREVLMDRDFSTFPEYLASVERRGTGLNYAAYIGHTALRLFVMGDAAYERTATPDDRLLAETIAT